MTSPTISCPYRNIVNFSHTSRIQFSANTMLFHPFKWLGAQMLKISRNSPFPLGRMDPHLIHQCLDLPHSWRQTTARSVHAFPHNYATKSPLVTMGHPKTAPSPSTISTPSNTPILRPTPITVPKSIWIQLAVLPQYTFWTHSHRHTHAEMG